MTATQKCSFFPQEPYYIPGYGGFYPQVRYQVGQSYGRTTSRMLTNPEVRKSPCSVLAPLRRPKFIEDFSSQNLPARDRMDQYQSHIPGYTGQDCQPPLPRALPLPHPPTWTEADAAQRAAQRKVTPCHPGIRLACGPGWRQFAATASSQLVSPKGDQKLLCHPDIALVCGQEERRGPCKTDMSLVCGQGWRGPPCHPGADQPTRTEGVPLPMATETVDVRRFDRTPRMDLPNLIQRKAISGYAGFIPCFSWIMGVNYLKGVKGAMNNFDRNQERLRNPLYSFGRRLPHTYWPSTKIYTSSGLVPFYTGFVPSEVCSEQHIHCCSPSPKLLPPTELNKSRPESSCNRGLGGRVLVMERVADGGQQRHLMNLAYLSATIRQSYALTFGNSTRQAYYDELQRRQHAA